VKAVKKPMAMFNKPTTNAFVCYLEHDNPFHLTLLIPNFLRIKYSPLYIKMLSKLETATQKGSSNNQSLGLELCQPTLPIAWA